MWTKRKGVSFSSKIIFKNSLLGANSTKLQKIFLCVQHKFVLVASIPAEGGDCFLLRHGVGGEVVDGVGDGLDLLRLVVGDVEDELLLERHDNLDDVE